jgi:hypothetical protein
MLPRWTKHVEDRTTLMDVTAWIFTARVPNVTTSNQIKPCDNTTMKQGPSNAFTEFEYKIN